MAVVVVLSAVAFILVRTTLKWRSLDPREYIVLVRHVGLKIRVLRTCSSNAVMSVRSGFFHAPDTPVRVLGAFSFIAARAEEKGLKRFLKDG